MELQHVSSQQGRLRGPGGGLGPLGRNVEFSGGSKALKTFMSIANLLKIQVFTAKRPVRTFYLCSRWKLAEAVAERYCLIGWC